MRKKGLMLMALAAAMAVTVMLSLSAAASDATYAIYCGKTPLSGGEAYSDSDSNFAKGPYDFGKLEQNIVEIGDLQFYNVTGWKLWKVNGENKLESIRPNILSFPDAAGVANTEKKLADDTAASNSSSTSYIMSVFEPVGMSCIEYHIPVYDVEGNNAGSTLTFSVENHDTVSFPDGLGADYWKLVYDGKEYRLNAAGDVWTNETNGIRKIGRGFKAADAKIQACKNTPEPSETNPSVPQPSVPESSEANPSVPESSVPQPSVPQPNVPDTTAPVIRGVDNGGTYYEAKTVNVTDANLKSVTVNGIAADMSAAVNGTIMLQLLPYGGTTVIMAEDVAGNKITYALNVWDTWVRDGISTDGSMRLQQNVTYKLGSGKWTVGGDNTVYEGSKDFYVKQGGEYSFTKK